MGKMFTLLFIGLLALALMAGYLILTQKITVGSLKIAAGEKQLEQGEQMVSEGKVKLSSGKQQLSQVSNGYRGIKKTSYVWLASLPVAGEVIAVVSNKVISNKIDAGKQQVANGKNKIKAGEEQLSAGKLELSQGKERLNLANMIRIACGVGAGIFASLFVVLGFCWRRSLVQFLKRSKT